MNSILSVLYVAILLAAPLQVHAENLEQPELLPTLIISEIKVWYDSTKGSSTPLITEDDDYNEFVELYNPTITPVPLADFMLEYRNSTGSVIVTQPVGEGLLGPGQYYTLGRAAEKGGKAIDYAGILELSSSGLVNSNGHLRLLYKDDQVVDESFSWGSLGSNSQTQSFSRTLNETGNYELFDPFFTLGEPSPQSSELLVSPETDTDQPTETEDDGGQNNSESTPGPLLTCEGVIISELLPNPSGSDAAGEYIELYNPTGETINLFGCSLQTSYGSKQYNLPAESIDPGMFLAFSSQTTGLTLPNNSGGTIWLLSPEQEISLAAYPGGIDDDVSWSLIDGIWEQSYRPTPGAINIAMPSQPCPDGQTRNSDTNKCQIIVISAVASLTPCKAGQERSPETNRCRTITTSVSSSLVPCRAGQERNPETNRCRNVLAASILAPCDEGEERNPDTNRCRKAIDAAGKLASVKDVKSPANSSNPPWLLIMGIVLLALGYAVYEWRQEITDIFRKIIKR